MSAHPWDDVKSDIFVLVTRWQPADTSKRVVVHTYGPYKSRAEANSHKGKTKRRFEKDRAEYLSTVPAGEFSLHVCEILTIDD